MSTRVFCLAAALLTGCTLDDPGANEMTPEPTFQPRTEILEIDCQRFDDRIELFGTVDVSLDIDQTFTLEQYSTVHLGPTLTTYACGNWRARSSTPDQAADAGCDRVADMPDSELVSINRTIKLVGSIHPRNIELDVQARALGAGGAAVISDIARVSCALPQ